LDCDIAVNTGGRPSTCDMYVQNLYVYIHVNFVLLGTNELPTLDTVDAYMTKLHSLISESPQEHVALAANVRGIINRLSFDG